VKLPRLAPAALLALAALCTASAAHADWTATGVFQYVDRSYDSTGFTGATANLPIRRALVQVLDADSGRVLASGATDSTGAFSIPVPDAATRRVYARALAATADTSRYRLRVVSDPYSASQFAVSGPAVSGHPPDSSMAFNGGSPMLAGMRSVGEAFNILDCLENGIDFEAAVHNGVRPGKDHPLTAYWNLSSNDGTYYLAHGIHLLKDDGYSDMVINHEQGHYMAAVFSHDDSPGGVHYLGDNGQDLRLAWSEGWATYFAASVRRHLGLDNPTWYCDLFSEAGDPGLNFSYEIETPSLSAIGASSEVSVTASLWDIVDRADTPDVAPGVDDDPLSLSDTTTWGVFANYMATPPGGRAVTLEVFWDGWFDRNLGHAQDMVTTFQMERIEFGPDAFENDNFAALAASIPADGSALHHSLYGAGDADWTRFSVTSGQSYVVETTGLVGGCDTRLALFGPDSTTQFGANDNRAAGDPSSRVAFTAGFTGTCYVRCDRVAGLGRYGSYDLRASRGTPTAAAFTEVTTVAGVGNSGNSRGVAWGDYDNDGWPDLYVCNTGPVFPSGAPNRLFRSNAGSTFTDATSNAGVAAGLEQHEGAAWADYDNDGNLDLVTVSIEGLHLFRNNGPPGYAFSEFTSVAGLSGAGTLARTVNWVDFDRDGFVDLYVARNDGPGQLWRNAGNLTFVPLTRGVEADAHTSALSAAWCDYDQDGRPDLALGLDGDSDGQSMRLFHQKPDTTFEEVTATCGVLGATGRIFGLAWGDYDGDGLMDLACANEGGLNYLYRNRGDGTFLESAFEANVQGGAQGTSPAWVDADNDGDLDLYVTNFGHPAALFDNLNGRSFTTSGLAGTGTDSRSVAAADFNRDGAADLYVGTQTVNVLYRGIPIPGRHWLQLALRGRASNRSGIGARAVAWFGGRRASREVSGGQAWGSQPSAVLHFGLGTALQADSVRIHWPSGRKTLLTHVSVDQILGADEDSTEVDSPSIQMPARVALRLASRNPFNPSLGACKLSFDVPISARGQVVRIAVYDVLGRLEALLKNEPGVPGANQSVSWNGLLSDQRRAPSGVHYVHMTAGGAVVNQKIVLVREGG
jgi:enediyne biosynthesis protein E4